MVVIHEFLHYVLHLVYKNGGAPYQKGDLNKENFCLELFAKCREIYNWQCPNMVFYILHEDENLGRSDPVQMKMILAELIVIPTSLMSFYKDHPEVLNFYRKS